MAGSRIPTLSWVTVPTSGVLPTTLALHGLQKPTLESLRRVDQHAEDQGLLRVAPRRSPRALVRLRASCSGGYRADCYKPLSSCILTSVLDKGEPAVRQGRKAQGPLLGKGSR